MKNGISQNIPVFESIKIGVKIYVVNQSQNKLVEPTFMGLKWNSVLNELFNGVEEPLSAESIQSFILFELRCSEFIEENEKVRWLKEELIKCTQKFEKKKERLVKLELSNPAFNTPKEKEYIQNQLRNILEKNNEYQKDSHLDKELIRYAYLKMTKYDKHVFDNSYSHLILDVNNKKTSFRSEFRGVSIYYSYANCLAHFKRGSRSSSMLEFISSINGNKDTKWRDKVTFSQL